MAEPDPDNGAKAPDAKADAAPAAGSWTRWIFNNLGAILSAGLVGTTLSAYFQWRSWEYQTQAARIEKDTSAVVGALEDLDKIMDQKWLTTYVMNDAVKTKVEGDKLKAATDQFYAANKDWELQHNILGSNLKIAVDSQFGIDDAKLVELTYPLKCTTYTLEGQQPHGNDPLSVRALLEISYNCHNIVKGKIEDALGARDKNGSLWPTTLVEPDAGGVILSHIWWVDKVLQCMMVERALELRHQTPQVPLIRFRRLADFQTYVPTEEERAREEQCVEQYKNNPTLGMAAPAPELKPQ